MHKIGAGYECRAIYLHKTAYEDHINFIKLPNIFSYLSKEDKW